MNTQPSSASAWTLSDTETFTRYGDACVPRRAEQIAVVCDLLSEIPAGPVLDLCCGQGLLAEEYLRRSPDGQVTLLDGSAEMLELACARLASYPGQYLRVQADIADQRWRRDDGGYAGVMTSLAVHHLDAAGKQALYQDLHRMLRPGGVFVMADLVEPTGQRARQLAADTWEQSVAEASERLFGGQEALTAFIATEWNYYRQPGPDDYDKPSSITEQLRWLSEAGFIEVDVAWLYAGHAIFTATRRS